MGKLDAGIRRLILLAIIYAGFVSLGLPDAVLGVAWPAMRPDFGRSVEAAGLLVAVTTVCSVLSSMLTGCLTARASCGVILTASGVLTMSAMLGYSVSPVWPLIVLLTIPLGIGQGAVDTALNSYVAKNYSARQMNWLHCCWGIGATGAPFVMTAALSAGLSWRVGYVIIAVIQASLTALFFLTLKLWSKQDEALPSAVRQSETAAAEKRMGQAKMLRSAAGCSFYFLYAGVESVLGLWGASLLYAMNASVKTVGLAVALFWGSLTVGRLITGAFLSGFADRVIIRGGLAAVIVGILTLMFTRSPVIASAAFTLIGLGCAPLYPCMMHDTPRRVGEFADKVIGMQVGSSFIGVSTLPALVGYAAAHSSMAVIPPVMLGFTLALTLAHEVSVSGISPQD